MNRLNAKSNLCLATAGCVLLLTLGFGGTAAADPSSAGAPGQGQTGPAQTNSAQTGPAQTEPADSSVLGNSPRQISIATTATPPSAGGTIVVYRTSHAVAAKGALVRSAENADKLVFPAPKLGRGLYTVVWSVAGATGSFAFEVDPSGVSPSVVSHPEPKFLRAPWYQVAVE
jgi:methionine-rich copper-binding protein CopC